MVESFLVGMGKGCQGLEFGRRVGILRGQLTWHLAALLEGDTHHRGVKTETGLFLFWVFTIRHIGYLLRSVDYLFLNSILANNFLSVRFIPPAPLSPPPYITTAT